jgi:hypothetical protein
MPSEVSIPKALSGAEIIEAIKHDVGQMLSHDDRLYPHVAYSGFEAHITIQIRTPASMIPGIDRELTIEKGDVTDLEETPSITASTDRDIQPPNQVRMETNQPLPVLVTNEKGQTHEKFVPYTDRRSRPSVPKNVVKGGESVNPKAPLGMKFKVESNGGLAS